MTFLRGTVIDITFHTIFESGSGFTLATSFEAVFVSAFDPEPDEISDDECAAELDAEEPDNCGELVDAVDALESPWALLSTLTSSGSNFSITSESIALSFIGAKTFSTIPESTVLFKIDDGIDFKSNAKL